MEEKKDKNQKLENKVKKLVEKLEDKIEEIKNEKSSVKRLQYIIKCKMLVNKIQRQQDLLKARKKFEKAKEDNNITAKEERVAARRKIIEYKKTIKYIEGQLKKHRQYDVNSSDFIFPKEDVENVGNIEEYIKELEESQEPEQIQVAEKIRGIIKYKELLEYTKGKLKEEQEKIKDLKYNLKAENNSISRKEMMVTAKSKFNIFAKIRNFTSSIVAGVREFREEVRENREVDKERLNAYGNLETNYEKEKAKIIKEYEQKMGILDDIYRSKDKEVETNHKESRKEKNTSRRNGQAAKFQEELQNMTKSNQEEPNLPSDEDIIRQTEANEQIYDEQNSGQEARNNEEEVLKGDSVVTPEGKDIEI